MAGSSLTVSNVVLNIQNLSLQLDGKTLLDDVSFAVDAGKILAVIGPNGAGKTSLLNAVADTQASGVSALSGLVEFARRSLADYSPLQRARNMAVLPQHSRLSFPFAVEEVIALGRVPHSSGATVDQQLIQSVATDLEIDN